MNDFVTLIISAIPAAAIVAAPVVANFRRLGRIENRIARVEFQHENNGGRSTRDAIDRIEAGGLRTETLVRDHLVEAAEARGRIETQIDELQRR